MLYVVIFTELNQISLRALHCVLTRTLLIHCWLYWRPWNLSREIPIFQRCTRCTIRLERTVCHVFFGRDTSEPVIDLDVTVPPTLQNLVDQWVLKRSTLECTKHGVNHGEEKNDVLEYPRMLMVRLKYSSTLHTERPMVLTNQHVNIQDERYLVRPPLTT